MSTSSITHVSSFLGCMSLPWGCWRWTLSGFVRYSHDSRRSATSNNTEGVSAISSCIILNCIVIFWMVSELCSSLPWSLSVSYWRVLLSLCFWMIVFKLFMHATFMIVYVSLTTSLLPTNTHKKPIKMEINKLGQPKKNKIKQSRTLSTNVRGLLISTFTEVNGNQTRPLVTFWKRYQLFKSKRGAHLSMLPHSSSLYRP